MKTMNHYKVIIAYDGTDYAGWQTQEHAKTIAGTLEKTFEHVFGQSIHLYGASRTDAGVHALGQVATFSTQLAIAPQKMLHAWSNSLPISIALGNITRIPSFENPRFNVRQKTYRYRFFVERPLPMIARYGWYYRIPINFEKLQDCFAIFTGNHDFRSFCTGDDYESTVRTIDEITLSQDNGAYSITIKAQSFLRYMIRRIIGACLYVASHDTLQATDLKKILDKKNPEHAMPKAPALGLMLHSIDYNYQIKEPL